MNSKEFRDFGEASLQYIINYLENLRDRKVLPDVSPGYLQPLLPQSAPEKGEPWQKLLEDTENLIMPGVTHWQSPHFHAYYPTGCSYPAIVAEMISASIACIGFSWISGPACTELEVIMMDWLGKMLGLPEEFLNCSEGPGGGVLQSSASETTLVGLLAAKDRMVKVIQEKNPNMDESTIKGKLIAYTSDQSNSSVEKAGLLGSMPMRLLPTDETCKLSAKVLEEAMKADIEAGLIPCYVVATLGTTGTCAFDNLEELGPLCNKLNVWLHVDAAYAGTAFCCPEFRHYIKGLEYADSFNFNPHKWMLINFDCSAMWVKNAKYLVEAFNVDRIYLQHQHEGSCPDYRHWQIPLGRRFRSLKIWFVLRIYGVEGIRNHVRKHVELAKYFESLVLSDKRFELASETSLGLVCFRVKGNDDITQKLLNKMSERKIIYVIPARWKGKLIIRFVVCSAMCEAKDVDFAWNEITSQLTEISEVNHQIDKVDVLSDSLTKCKINALNEKPQAEKTAEKTK